MTYVHTEKRYLPGDPKPELPEGWVNDLQLGDDVLRGSTKCPQCKHAIEWVSKVKAEHLTFGVNPEEEHNALKEHVASQLDQHARTWHGAN